MKTKSNKNPKKPPSNSSVKKGKKGFKKGLSGNPGGRPVGSRNKLTQLAQKLPANDAEEIITAIIEKAKAGDSTAQRLCMERIMPPMRSSVIQIDLPKLETAQDIMEGYDVLFDALGRGNLTLEELDRLSDVLENKRKAIETVVLAEEMERLMEHVGYNR
jgi:hypothetical protein